ncbi:MAG: DUF2752 domain-containing protein [Sphaerobacteraceae bacterium]|nr:MAG: DUF2752 domain-containing protein [Sphaerobacteraceae bacterium]
MHAEHPPPSRFNQLVPAIGSIVLLIAGFVMIYVVNPVTTRLIPPCPFLWATNCYCPGCGAARAFHALARGDLGTAFSYNPLLILALPALGYVYMSFLSSEFFGKRLPAPTGIKTWTWLIPATLVVFWVARNLPWEPFTWLAP